MGQILIRGIDDRLLAAFKVRARRHGRSQEQEARMLIEDAARADRAWKAFVKFARSSLRELREKGSDYGNAAEEVRSDRAR